MMALGKHARRAAVVVGTCAAMVGVGACGGAETPAARTDTQAPNTASTTASEKPFVAGGRIEMQLSAGDYAVRPSAGNAIRVTVSGNVGATNVDVTTKESHANVSVKDTPRNNFHAVIEVPRTADLVIRLTAGDLKVDAISGNKDIESNAGNVDIVTGDSTDYASVDTSVQAGDLNVAPFGESQSGLFRSFTWSGKGKYTLRAKLLAGNLTLRGK
jgi:hypothetical protein